MRFFRTLVFAFLICTAAQVLATTLTGDPTLPTESFPVTKANSTGLRRLLYLRVIFPDQLTEPISEKNVAANLKTMTDFYQENSYGKLTFLNTIAPVVMLPHTFDWYKIDYQLNNPTQLAFPDVLMADAKEAARAVGCPADTCHQVVLHFVGSLTGNRSGVASSGGSEVCITGAKVDMLEHELGHNMGSEHAEFWNTSGASVAGPGANRDYGSPNDVMGNPTLALSASSLAVAAGVPIDLTAVATDPDGDALAYFWDFGDKLAGFNGSSFSTNNAAAQSKTYGSAGYYLVRCTASDMKGGATTKSLLITVGSPTTFTISGTVTQGGSPLANVRVHNGLIGVSGKDYRGAYTDGDGAYTITNLSAANVTLSTSLADFTFAASGFSNPVAVGPNQTGMNFTATAGARVSIEAVDASATEGGDTALLRLTRTGCTASALTVYVDLSQNVAGEYSLGPSPGYAASPSRNFTIPAGSSVLNVTVTASNDGNLDGAQVLQVSLMNTNAAYLATGPATVAVTLNDDDINASEKVPPRVSIVIADAEATENNPADTAQFIARRTGDTTAPLTVNFTVDTSVDDSAAPSDYAAIGGSVIIPAGSSSVPITIAPVDDSEVEESEVVRLLLIGGPDYVSDAQVGGNIKIIDDDIATVSITATDATANENGDPARFTFTVNYTVGGTSTSNVDFIPFTNSVTLGKNSTADITITPMNDNTAEDVDTVILTLQPSATYTLDSKSSATIDILDDDVANIISVSSNTTSLTDGGTGKFYFSRSGSTASPRTVSYAVSGTAANPADYNAPALTGTVTISAASTGVYVDVISKADGKGELTENIIVTLLPDPISPAGYTINSGTAALNIADTDGGLPPIEQWRIAQFGAASTTPAAADLADADFDGFVNFLEYALHRDPQISDKPLLDAGMFSITYQRVVAATELTYTVEWSPDLTIWNTIGITEEILATDGVVQTIRARITPSPGASSGFLRLKVTRN